MLQLASAQCNYAITVTSETHHSASGSRQLEMGKFLRVRSLAEGVLYSGDAVDSTTFTAASANTRYLAYLPDQNFIKSIDRYLH